MTGNKIIADILKTEYGVKNLAPYEEINYEIENLSDDISRVKITSKTGDSFCCPVYALFDGYHMSWYGDYGFWGFCCTWKTNVMNLAYQSPYYQLEKLESRERKEFDQQECIKNLLKLIKEGFWYNYDLDEEQKKRFNEYITTAFDYIDYDDVLYEYEDTCEKLKDLYNATQDEFDWVSTLRNINFEESNLNSVFDCEEYELYNIGKKEPGRFFIILYMLSVVANSEEAKKQENKTKGENR